MSVNSMLVVLAAVVAVTVALRSAGHREESLRNRGISVTLDGSGCQIEHSNSHDLRIASSIFAFYMSDEEGVTSFRFDDFDRSQVFVFDKFHDYFKLSITHLTVAIDRGEGFPVEHTWRLLEENGVLPLRLLSPNIRAKLKRTRTTFQDCLEIVDAIVGNPPPGYEMYKYDGYWLSEFYRRNLEVIRKVFVQLRARKLLNLL